MAQKHTFPHATFPLPPRKKKLKAKGIEIGFSVDVTEEMSRRGLTPAFHSIVDEEPQELKEK